MAQLPFGLGLKVGVPLNDALSAPPGGQVTYTQSTHRYVAGPYAEFRLPAGFGVEIDALYRTYEYRQVAAGTSVSTGAWEFPVLARKGLLGGPIQPYIEGGVALSHLTVPDVAELNRRNNYGVVLGAGVALHLGLFRISPELRYNGWFLKGFNSQFGDLGSNRNQAALLVGINF